MNRRFALLPLLLLASAACGGSKEATPQAAQTPQEAPAAAAPAPGPAADSGPGPISSRGTSPGAGGGAPSAPGAAPAAGGTQIAFELPKGWTSKTPQSPMRIAEASIAGPGAAGELAVFYFGPGQGGGVDANLERWIGQMEPEKAGPKPERGTLEAHGLKITWLDVHGTLKPSTMGSGPADPVPAARLFGAVVEGPGGPWFFKVTGPDTTLAPQKDAFFALLKSLHPAANT